MPQLIVMMQHSFISQFTSYDGNIISYKLPFGYEVKAKLEIAYIKLTNISLYLLTCEFS